MICDEYAIYGVYILYMGCTHTIIYYRSDRGARARTPLYIEYTAIGITMCVHQEDCIYRNMDGTHMDTLSHVPTMVKATT